MIDWNFIQDTASLTGIGFVLGKLIGHTEGLWINYQEFLKDQPRLPLKNLITEDRFRQIRIYSGDSLGGYFASMCFFFCIYKQLAIKFDVNQKNIWYVSFPAAAITTALVWFQILSILDIKERLKSQQGTLLGIGMACLFFYYQDQKKSEQ